MLQTANRSLWGWPLKRTRKTNDLTYLFGAKDSRRVVGWNTESHSGSFVQEEETFGVCNKNKPFQCDIKVCLETRRKVFVFVTCFCEWTRTWKKTLNKPIRKFVGGIAKEKRGCAVKKHWKNICIFRLKLCAREYLPAGEDSWGVHGVIWYQGIRKSCLS